MLGLLTIACDGPSDADRPPRADPTGDTAPAPKPEPTPPDPDLVERFRLELEAAGFLLQEGEVALADPAGCCDWESCYLFNPDNDYIGWWLPPGPGQTAVDPIPDGQGRSLAFRLRHDEAAVAIGRTPPAAAYFSFRSYIHDRWYPVIGRDWLFYNLGDSLNQFVMGTGEGGPFDADYVLVSTPDAGTEAAIRAAAARAGIPDGVVNTDVIGGTEMTLGLHDEADTFRMQHRIALFEDPVAREAYLADPPVTVWRVTPAIELPHAPLKPLPPRPRGSGTDESAWAPALDELDLAIRAAYPDYNPTQLPTVTTGTEGDDCPPGCNRDTWLAFSIHWFLPEGADAFVVVYGVNHQRTGKSVYSNFSIIETEHASAVAAIHSGIMPGSAAPYLPGHPQVDDLYAWKVARSCAIGDPYCIEVPLECPGWPSLGQGAVAYRAYTEAATATGPSASELVHDRAVLFTRPAKP